MTTIFFENIEELWTSSKTEKTVKLVVDAVWPAFEEDFNHLQGKFKIFVHISSKFVCTNKKNQQYNDKFSR